MPCVLSISAALSHQPPLPLHHRALLCRQRAPFRCGSGTSLSHSPGVSSAPMEQLPAHPTCFPFYPCLPPSEWPGCSLAWRWHPVWLDGAHFSPLHLGLCFENEGGNPCSPLRLAGPKALCCKSRWECKGGQLLPLSDSPLRLSSGRKTKQPNCRATESREEAMRKSPWVPGGRFKTQPCYYLFEPQLLHLKNGQNWNFYFRVWW